MYYLDKEFINSKKLPSFIENMDFPKDIIDNKFFASFILFKNSILAKSNCHNYKQVKSGKPSNAVPVLAHKMDGFLDFKGKVLIKIIVNILNKVGRKLPRWSNLGEDRVIDMLIHQHKEMFTHGLERIESRDSLSWVYAIQVRRSMLI